jgi:hypothetical protein
MFVADSFQMTSGSRVSGEISGTINQDLIVFKDQRVYMLTFVGFFFFFLFLSNEEYFANFSKWIGSFPKVLSLDSTVSSVTTGHFSLLIIRETNLGSLKLIKVSNRLKKSNTRYVY